ncbi:hypothetical protein [Pseudooceanicola algae]|nr:hypothetical protein [Pseudooceanicola algae]
MIGPIELISVLCGYSEKAAYRWRHPSNTRAGGDFPSLRDLRRLHAHVRAHDLPLKPEWLIWGAFEDEVEAAIRAHPCPLPLVARLRPEVAAQ